MTEEEARALSWVGQHAAFVPVAGNLFMLFYASAVGPPRWFWAVDAGGFEEVTEKEAHRRLEASYGMEPTG